MRCKSHPCPYRSDSYKHCFQFRQVLAPVPEKIIYAGHYVRQVFNQIGYCITHIQHRQPHVVQLIASDVLQKYLPCIFCKLYRAGRCRSEPLVFQLHAACIGVGIAYLVKPVFHGFQVVRQARNALYSPSAKEVVQRRKLFRFRQVRHGSQKILHRRYRIFLHRLCQSRCRYTQLVQHRRLPGRHRFAGCQLQDHALYSRRGVFALHAVRCQHRAQHSQRLGRHAADLAQVSDACYHVRNLFLARCRPVRKVVDLVCQQYHFVLIHAKRRAPLCHHLPGLRRVHLKGNRHFAGVLGVLYQLVYRHAALRANGGHACEFLRGHGDLRRKFLYGVRDLIVGISQLPVFVSQAIRYLYHARHVFFKRHGFFDRAHKPGRGQRGRGGHARAHQLRRVLHSLGKVAYLPLRRADRFVKALVYFPRDLDREFEFRCFCHSSATSLFISTSIRAGKLMNSRNPLCVACESRSAHFRSFFAPPFTRKNPRCSPRF